MSLPAPVRHHSPSTQAIMLGVALIVAAIVVSQSGCSHRREVLTAEIVALNTARDTFTQWTHDYQSAIVAKATSREQVLEDIAAHRKLQAAVVTVLANAYLAIAQAATSDSGESLQRAQSMVRTVTKILGGLGPASPPPDCAALGCGGAP